jgi:hypothetical protein
VISCWSCLFNAWRLAHGVLQSVRHLKGLRQVRLVRFDTQARQILWAQAQSLERGNGLVIVGRSVGRHVRRVNRAEVHQRLQRRGGVCRFHIRVGLQEILNIGRDVRGHRVNDVDGFVVLVNDPLDDVLLLA